MDTSFISITAVAFQIGSLSVRWYGIIISLGMALGIYLAYREVKREHQDVYKRQISSCKTLIPPRPESNTATGLGCFIIISFISISVDIVQIVKFIYYFIIPQDLFF